MLGRWNHQGLDAPVRQVSLVQEIQDNSRESPDRMEPLNYEATKPKMRHGDPKCTRLKTHTPGGIRAVLSWRAALLRTAAASAQLDAGQVSGVMRGCFGSDYTCMCV